MNVFIEYLEAFFGGRDLKLSKNVSDIFFINNYVFKILFFWKY